MDLAWLEYELSEARKRLERARKAHAPWEGTEYQETWQEVLKWEREIALAKGEQVALACEEWNAQWCPSDPSPYVVSSGRHTILILRLSRRQIVEDGLDPQSFALVAFRPCYEHKFGGPNDEVVEGLPWHGRGLDLYEAHVIANSAWVEEIKRINSVHRLYKSSQYDDLKHYVLLFHDDMFECLAKGFDIEIVKGSLTEVVKLGTNRLLEEA